jgi:hypothetical protein
MSAEFSIVDSNLIIKIQGFHKVLCFKRVLKIPMKQIAAVKHFTEDDKGMFKGLRALGINIPGIITAGTFYQEGKKTFWDVRNPSQSIILELKDNSFSKIIVEVSDRNAIIAKIQATLCR